jgi:hypothetical protein
MKHIINRKVVVQSVEFTKLDNFIHPVTGFQGFSVHSAILGEGIYNLIKRAT